MAPRGSGFAVLTGSPKYSSTTLPTLGMVVVLVRPWLVRSSEVMEDPSGLWLRTWVHSVPLPVPVGTRMEPVERMEGAPVPEQRQPDV